MADYYPALLHAVSRLSDHTAPARQAVYEHARSNIVTILRRHNLHISELEIMRERAALETAIGKLEATFLPPQTHTPTAEPEEIDRNIKRGAAKSNIGLSRTSEWQGALLIGVALFLGMMTFSGLMYAAIRLFVL
jgi:hypothetical protein